MTTSIENRFAKNKFENIKKLPSLIFQDRPIKPKPSSLFSCQILPSQSLKTLENGITPIPRIESSKNSSSSDDHFYNHFGEKIKNWATGYGYINDQRKDQEIEEFQKKIDGMPQESKEQFITQTAIDCNIPGMKTGLGCWMNTQTALEIVVTGGLSAKSILATAEKTAVKTSAQSIEKTAFEIAMEGGEHSGQLKQFMKWTPKQLEKSIKSFEKNIIKHQGWIKNPQSKVTEWNSFRLSHQQNLIQHWIEDVKRAQDFKNIAEEVLKRMKGN